MNFQTTIPRSTLAPSALYLNGLTSRSSSEMNVASACCGLWQRSFLNRSYTSPSCYSQFNRKFSSVQDSSNSTTHKLTTTNKIYLVVSTSVIATSGAYAYLTEKDKEKKSSEVFDKENKRLKIQRCEKLKAELVEQLKQLTFEEIKALFEKRGPEFIEEMDIYWLWHYNRSILENALREVEDLSKETVAFLVDYYVSHSEHGKITNMNQMHVLARNSGGYIPYASELLKEMVIKHPECLRERMIVKDFRGTFEMTPVELVIEESYSENLMRFMVSEYYQKVDFSRDDAEKLLCHAKRLSKSGIATTGAIGKRMCDLIRQNFF